MARRIRIWKPGGCYHVTLNCMDRMFLLKPSPEVNNILGSSLGRAQKRYPVLLHSATTNINHMELVFSLGTEKSNNASSFLRNFGSLVAKEMNRLLKREGHFWSGRAKVEEIISDEKAEKLLGYGACNVVKDGLVEKAAHWKGFSTTRALSNGEKLVFEYVNRTKWWNLGSKREEADPSEYMERVEVKLAPLLCWRGKSREWRKERFAQIVREREKLSEKEREAEGMSKVKGMEKIERTSPFAKPSRPRVRSPQPLCHADTKEAYELYKAEYEETVRAHRIASEAYRSGHFEVEFPPYTFRPPLVTVYLVEAA